MRKFVLSAVAGLAALAANAVTSEKAEAGVSVRFGFGGPVYAAPVGWGHHPGYYHRPRPVYRGYGGGYYAGPTCFVKRRWVHGPFGPEVRAFRVCR